MEPIWLSFCAIVSMCLWPIYVGCHRSATPSPNKGVESLEAKEAAMFPVYASGTLLTLYIVFRLVNADIINMVVNVVFALFSAFAVADSVRPLMPGHAGEGPRSWKVVVPGIVGIAVSAAYSMSKHWILNNVIGLSFSVLAIEHMVLPNFKVAGLLLVGLFVYDIFWVFGTEVMVTVAKSFNAPIKLLFPQNIFAETYTYSMIGLGDIVIPGIFIALMLRFDGDRTAHSGKRFVKKNYFNACYIAYILGLAVCILIMAVFKAAQPALLYLVPFCVLSVIGLAVARNELSDLFKYDLERAEDTTAIIEEHLTTKEQILRIVQEFFGWETFPHPMSPRGQEQARARLDFVTAAAARATEAEPSRKGRKAKKN